MTDLASVVAWASGGVLGVFVVRFAFRVLIESQAARLRHHLFAGGRRRRHPTVVVVVVVVALTRRKRHLVFGLMKPYPYNQTKRGEAKRSEANERTNKRTTDSVRTSERASERTNDALIC